MRVNEVVQKVTAFIVREQGGVKELLVFIVKSVITYTLL